MVAGVQELAKAPGGAQGRGTSLAVCGPGQRATRRHRGAWWGLCSAAALAGALVACKAGTSAHGDDPPPTPPPPLAFERKVPWPEPYASSGAWRRAASDPEGLELPRLAEAAGAQELLELVEAGGDLGALALLAIQYLPDPFANRAELCGLLGRTTPESSGLLLDAVGLALQLGPQSVESIEPAADQVCITSLASLLERADIAEGPRATAQSLLAHLVSSTNRLPNAHPPRPSPG